MKLKSIFLAGLTALMAVTACKKAPDAPVQGTDEPNYSIRLSHSVYQFTKATDTAFEEGDVIGVHVFPGESCWLYNAKFTMESGVLTPESDYKWHEDTDVAATVTAVYPATNREEYGTPETFTVQSDQSTLEGYKMSDLMFAQTTSKPTEEAVVLPFKHAMSKVIITIDNQLKEDIADVFLTNLYGSLTYDAKTLETITDGSKAAIKAYKSNETTWVLIVAPQTDASPDLAITTASGKQYTFKLSETVEFKAGKQRTAEVVISQESISTSFTPEIEDWTSDSELNFSQSKEEEEGGNSEVTEPTEPTTPTEVRIYLKNDWGWTYVWCWDKNNNQIFENKSWPGTQYHGEKDGYFYWVVPEDYVGETVSILAVKKTDTEQEQSADYTNLTLDKDVYFHLEWTQETGVRLIKEDK